MTLLTPLKSHLKISSLIGVTIATSIFSMTAHADVTLLVDDNIKVTAINGQEIRQSSFQPLKKQFSLQAGKHVITAKYDRLYELRNDNHDYLRSANVSVSAELKDNQTYRLVMPNQPEDYQQAKKFAEKPTLAIEQDSKIIAKQEAISSEGGLFSGLSSAIGGVFGGRQAAKQTNQQTIAALGQSSSNTPVTTDSDNTLDKFMALWLNASPEEREKIRQWVTK